MSNFLDLKHPILILIRGLPGSGKTHLATALQERIGKDAVLMLDPDATDYQSKEYAQHTQALSAEGVDAKLHPFRFLRAKAYKGIAGHELIIWNQPFSNTEIFKRVTDNLETYATEHGTHLPILVVEVKIDPSVAKERVLTRKNKGGHGPSDSTFARFTDDYETVASEGYNTVTVSGHDNVAVSVDKVIQALRNLPAQ